MDRIICPACGATDIIVHDSSRTIIETYGNPVHIPEKKYSCQVCGTEGDFTSENEIAINEGIEKAKESALHGILEFFQTRNFSMSAIERCLELPQRTLTKWKSAASKPSAAGFALMNIIRTYPWILEVAEKKYEQKFSRDALISAGVNEFLKIAPLRSVKTFIQFGFTQTDNMYFSVTAFEKTPTPITGGNFPEYQISAKEVSYENN